AVVAARDLVEHAAHTRRVLVQVGAVRLLLGCARGHPSSLGGHGGRESVEPTPRGGAVERSATLTHAPLEVDGERLEVLDDIERVPVFDAVLVPLVAVVDEQAALVGGPYDVEVHVDAGRLRTLPVHVPREVDVDAVGRGSGVVR